MSDPHLISDKFEQAAFALRAARQNGQPIARISESFEIQSLEEAYAVAEINRAYAVSQGQRIVGKKVGLTSKAVQTQLGVDQPDFGILFADMEYLDQAKIPAQRLMQAKAEAEIAFIVAKDLPSHSPTWAEFLSCIDYALAAIEIVDSAIADWKITLVDTVADNASCGVYVLGNQPVAVGSVDFASLGMQLTKNGEIVSVGSGSACLDHPLRAAWWLAKTMAQRGQSLKAGEIILSGALGPMVAIEQGDVIEARIGLLGSVSCQLV